MGSRSKLKEIILKPKQNTFLVSKGLKKKIGTLDFALSYPGVGGSRDKRSFVLDAERAKVFKKGFCRITLRCSIKTFSCCFLSDFQCVLIIFFLIFPSLNAGKIVFSMTGEKRLFHYRSIRNFNQIELSHAISLMLVKSLTFWRPTLV